MYNVNKYYFWLFYKENFEYKDFCYNSVYDFFEFENETISYKEKFDVIYDYLYKKLTENKSIEFRTIITYLKKFVITDCKNQNFCNLYNDVIIKIRETIMKRL